MILLTAAFNLLVSWLTAHIHRNRRVISFFFLKKCLIQEQPRLYWGFKNSFRAFEMLETVCTATAHDYVGGIGRDEC